MSDDQSKIFGTALAAVGIAKDLAAQDYISAGLQTVGLLKDAGTEFRTRRFGWWWAGIIKNSKGKTPQEVQGSIEAKIKEHPDAKEAVWASARAVLDAISDESAEIIGSLTNSYLDGELHLDSFYRGSVRILADLSTEDLRVCRTIVDLGAHGAAPEVKFRHKDGTLSREPASGRLDQRIVKDDEARIRRVFRLLKTHDLGRDAPAGKYGAQSGPHIVILELAVLKQLKHHLG